MNLGAVVALLALATTGFVEGTTEPAIAGGGPTSYFAEGDIVGSNPFSSDVSGITEAEFVRTCSYPPESQGADGWVFQLPEGFVVPAPFTVKGTSAGPYDLDVFFYNAACGFISGIATSSPDESGTVPAQTAYIVVDQFIGADTHVVLCAGDPAGCVPGASSSSGPPPSSEPPPSGEMTTTLGADRRVTAYRQLFTMSGVVSGDEECGEPSEHRVGVTKRILGTSQVESLDRIVPVGEDGSWSLRHRSAHSAEYVARVSPSESCESQASYPIVVHARVEIALLSNRPDPCRGFVMKGEVRPSHEGTTVLLQRHDDERFQTIAEDGLDENSRFGLDVPRCGLYRVVWERQAESNKWGAVDFKYRK